MYVAFSSNSVLLVIRNNRTKNDDTFFSIFPNVPVHSILCHVFAFCFVQIYLLQCLFSKFWLCILNPKSYSKKITTSTSTGTGTCTRSHARFSTSTEIPISMFSKFTQLQHQVLPAHSEWVLYFREASCHRVWVPKISLPLVRATL